MNHSLDWNEHIKQVAVNWLSKGEDNISLEPDMLMLFGNPDLFQENQLISLFEHISPVGVFFKGTYGGCSLTYCRPLFGAPIVAMYLEVAARLGVKNIVACGYVGGILADIEVGSYVVPAVAYGLDGCTRNYSPDCLSFPSYGALTSRLCTLLDRQKAKYTVGSIVSIDALMLENDALIEDFARQRYCAVDLETACLYALGARLGLNVASIHIVSDSPGQKLIDRHLHHEASFPEQLKVAIDGLTSLSTGQPEII